jgi:Zinc finger, C3HC4 type (RING finger)
MRLAMKKGIAKSLELSDERKWEFSNDEECRICLENKQLQLTLPCKHLDICSECSQVENCLICTRKVALRMKTVDFRTLLSSNNKK